MNTIKINDIDSPITKDITSDISVIIEQSQKVAYSAVDLVLLKRNWLIGKRIYEEELKETRKENYGKEIISKLAIKLNDKYGNGFTYSNLYRFYKFYILYKDIFESPIPKSFLNWTHYSTLISINDKNARDWYENEAKECGWSVRTLKRNIQTQYYYRLLKSIDKETVKKEMEEKTLNYKLNKLEHIKNPTILEFLNISPSTTLLENDLEQKIINNLQKMLLELGKGYAFVGRQYHIKTNTNDYYVDLVFYNYYLKCFVLIDLKTQKITHQDVGQMDMYVKMFDELIKNNEDNPTLGIILCSDSDEDVVKYSIINESNQLFMSKYKLYLPSEEELRAEIEYQKELMELM